MKINDVGRLGSIPSYKRQIENQRLTDAKRSNRKDELSISPEAMEMLKSKEQAAGTDKAQRIQELKAQVASGTYQVDAGKIAEKMVPYFKSQLDK